jgi:hypothetical protein
LNPSNLALDASGNLYITDTTNNRVREVNKATGIITTVAGTGVPGFSGDGGPATAAQLDWPAGLAMDRFGNLYIGDLNNMRIRKISSPVPTPTPTATAGPACQGSFFVSRNIYFPKTDQPALFIRTNFCITGVYSVKIYNTAGEHIRTLRDVSNQTAGADQVDWDGKNKNGVNVASGVYIIIFTEPAGVHIAKVVVMR